VAGWIKGLSRISPIIAVKESGLMTADELMDELQRELDAHIKARKQAKSPADATRIDDSAARAICRVLKEIALLNNGILPDRLIKLSKAYKCNPCGHH
jgi:hypothetical protein